MKTLELFAGSRSFSKVAQKLGHQTYTTDNQDFEQIDQVCDIFNFDIDKMLEEYGHPDIIWASPPCTAFSVASIGHHWNQDHTPKTEKAVLGVEIVQRTKEIIEKLNPQYYFVENPRGKLRKLPVVDSFPYQKTITYCSYGDMRMKPTDIWSNTDFTTRPMCFNGNKDCHHAPAPRGSKTGTQGLKGDYLRSQIPAALFEDLFAEIGDK
tara:strand:+ start:552 stop:1178 length:627 start_codon:yes stop_codon:yes gene_type:complete